MMWWHGPGYALTAIGMVLFWQLVVFGVIVLIRCLGNPNQSAAEKPLLRRCSTSRSTDSVGTCRDDHGLPATRARRKSLRLVSPV
jgi:hypothetical protein